MSIESILDYVAVRSAANITGLKAAYSTAASSEGATGIPRSIEDGPVAFVLPGDGDAEPGNWEQELHTFEVEVWVPAADMATAYRAIIPFAGRFKTQFRADIDNNTTAVRVLYRGYRKPFYDDTAGKPFLVMSIQMEALEIRASDDYTT